MACYSHDLETNAAKDKDVSLAHGDLDKASDTNSTMCESVTSVPLCEGRDRSNSEHDSRGQGSETNTGATCKDSLTHLELQFRCLNFENYNFDSDGQFQDGWKKLAGVIPKDQADQQYLKARLFYYSKHCEPLNLHEYLQWRKQRTNVQDKSPSCSAPREMGDNSCSTESAGIQASASDSTDTDSRNLTFSEVMEFVQSGKPIPGIKTLDVKPTGAIPTASTIERKTKPWEINSDEN